MPTNKLIIVNQQEFSPRDLFEDTKRNHRRNFKSEGRDWQWKQ